MDKCRGVYKYRFFDKFCTGIKHFDEEVSLRLKAAGYPADEGMYDKDVSIIKDIELKEKSYIIIRILRNGC